MPIVPTKLQSYAKGLSNTSNIIPDLSATLPIGLYCMIGNSLKLGCLQYNVVDMWKYDLKTIKSLTLDDVLNKLNTTIQRYLFIYLFTCFMYLCCSYMNI